MPVVNIIDNRKNKYRWKKVTAMAEPAFMNERRTARGGVDTTEAARPNWTQKDTTGISLQQAIEWAMKLDGETTLYIENCHLENAE